MQRYISPYKALQHIKKVAYWLQFPQPCRPFLDFSLLKPAIQDPLAGRIPTPTQPEPQEIERQPTYRVKSVLTSCCIDGNLYYLIEWEG